MNRLSKEKSPYLLQHANNPVEWYPWGDEAFEKAKTEDKPVFLSVGYATCHWCHVMEHESFEDEQVAERMNDGFVNIKVDREERPDIDNTYMAICQMLTGRGGWPLTIIMTPDKEPFFAATEIPKRSTQRMQGMLDLIPQIQSVWQQDRPRVIESVKKIKAGFTSSLHLGQTDRKPSAEVTQKAAEQLSKQFDEKHGGFGSQPKFPSPHNLLFLLRYAVFSKDDHALHMAEKTLTQMRLGGIWDHIGGGFHRYSTDSEWLLPHFEKMLYDQSMLLLAYAEAWRVSGNDLFKKTCYEIFRYLNGKMKSDKGAYYSAEDADSEGEEGKFYVWEKQDIYDALPKSDADLFCQIYQIKENGNFRDEATREFTGKNIPHLTDTIKTIAEKRGDDFDKLSEKLQHLRSELYVRRDTRVHPLLDDKILTDWNGLLMAAFATAGAIFDDPEFTKAASEIEQFIDDTMTGENNSLLHRYREGDAAIEGMANDYTAVVWGLTELHQTTQNPEYLEKALRFHETFVARFLDKDHGGFFFTSETAESLLGRQKEIYDGALPSSNSIAALNAFRLSRLTGNMEFDEQAEKIYSAFSEMIEDHPAGYTFSLISLLVKEHQPAEIVVTGGADDSETGKILNLFKKEDRFKYSVLLMTDQNAEQAAEISEFLKQFSLDGSPAVYVCRDFSCNAPVHSAEELEGYLRG